MCCIKSKYFNYFSEFKFENGLQKVICKQTNLSEMKSTSFSHIQVCARIMKEPYDDQYQECCTTLGENEIQFKFGIFVVFSNITF